ncbi:MAG: PIN domain nuclease [Anaerolineae bacterium]|nr:PIN domain nuclease [Anaerolineae bacterium]
MTPDFISRIIGMVVFAIAGARLGVQTAEFLNLDVESRAFIFGLVGLLFGLVVTPWVTVRPIRFMRHSINELPIERLLMTLTGALVGLTLALLAAYPLSLLPVPFGTFIPPLFMVIAAYLGMSIFGIRTREILDMFSNRFGKAPGRTLVQSSRRLLLDTSVLIDGRIVDVAETGFIGGTLIAPRFVLNELHRVADSSDQLRRDRGRRGLRLLNKIQRSDDIPVTIVDDDFEDIPEVDNKLIALAQQMNAAIITNDYNLNQLAEAQGIPVLNINRLSNAVRPMVIPGEKFPVRIIQEGRDANQGVGYLDDGTMIVVENGKSYMDRTIMVSVTKLINKDTGRMIFAVPEAQGTARVAPTG